MTYLEGDMSDDFPKLKYVGEGMVFAEGGMLMADCATRRATFRAEEHAKEIVRRCNLHDYYVRKVAVERDQRIMVLKLLATIETFDKGGRQRLAKMAVEQLDEVGGEV